MIELPWHPERILITGDFPGFTPEELFDHWTQPELLAKFWAPEAEIDLAVGGYYKLSWPKAGTYLHGHYTTVERGVHLCLGWTWNYELGVFPPAPVDLFFGAIDGGARMLTIDHGGFGGEDAAAKPSIVGGWLHFGGLLQGLRG